MPEQIIESLDSILGEYYLANSDSVIYFDNDTKIGKFQNWCDENGYDDDTIEDELSGPFDDALCYQFDTDDDDNNIFPLNPDIDDDILKNKQIFEILKNIRFHGHWKRIKLDANDINIDINESQIMYTYNLYTKYIKTWGNNGHQNCNMLHFLAISLQNNLIMHIVDSLRRQKIKWMLNDLYTAQSSNEWMDQTDNSMQNKVQQWMSKNAFIRDLNAKCKKLKKNYSLQKVYNLISGSQNMDIQPNKSYKTESLSLESAILTYSKRIGDHLVLRQTHKIKDNFKIIATYIVVSGVFIKQLLNEQRKEAPFLVDFMMVFAPLVSDHKVVHIANGKEAKFDEKEADSDDDDAHKLDAIGDITEICAGLEAAKCLYQEGTVCDTVFEQQEVEMDPIPLARTWIQLGLFRFAGRLKSKVRQKYPQFHRLNVVVDRRNSDKKQRKDPLIFFEPPEHCRFIPKEEHPPELYFDLSRQCLIPRAKGKSLDATNAANGQLMTFSYHVRAENDIKCYLLWNGQCVRFYPQDILDLLPHLFVMDERNKKFIESVDAIKLVQQMEIPDTKFEEFYSALTNKKSNQFPKRYEH